MAVNGSAAHPLEIERLWTGYGQTPVLQDITLTVHADEIFGVLGLNGAGKTSLFKAIMLLVEPEAGTVRLFGEPHRCLSARSRLAYLPERFQPPGHLSGHDYLRLTLAFHGCRLSRARIAMTAEELGLDPIALDRPINCYAKSMAQKLGVLATLLTDLPVLVLDEPLSGLAPEARRLLKQQLAACRARGRTVLLSSAIASDHEQLCDRIAILHRGRLAYVGAPAQLQARHGAPTLETAFRAAIEAPRLLTAAAP